MTRYLITPDPGTAACAAKNLTAVPGLPHPRNDLEGRTSMVGATPVNEPDHHAWLMSRTRDLAEAVGRMSWAVDELLFILDERVGELYLTQHERRAIARAREIADAVRPGGER